MSQNVNFLRTFNRWRRGDETLEQPSPRVVGEMIDAACDEIEQLTQQRDEARGWAEAAWAKADRAEKMLRIAAAKADEARGDYERVCRALAAKEGK
jgi:hypothetical protein